jgi:hypothetical protein
MILNGELSDWYFVFVFPIGIGQIAKDVAIGEDAAILGTDAVCAAGTTAGRDVGNIWPRDRVVKPG